MTSLIPGRISVVIPAYNQEAYICDALASLERQKLVQWEMEVLVVDDASTDATASLIETYIDRVPGLKLIKVRAERVHYWDGQDEGEIKL